MCTLPFGRRPFSKAAVRREEKGPAASGNIIKDASHAKPRVTKGDTGT